MPSSRSNGKKSARKQSRRQSTCRTKPPCQEGFVQYKLVNSRDDTACCRRKAKIREDAGLSGLKYMFKEPGNRPLSAWAKCLKYYKGSGLKREQLFNTCRGM